jgi:5'-nucleotidase
MRALITNDDGIESEGLRRLVLVALEAGLEPIVAAPSSECSGASASLTAVQRDGRVLVSERKLQGLDGIPAYAVDAVPAFIALIATRGAFGQSPDVVLSGVNRGLNVGHAILHSGTVGAALTGHTQGCRAMAVSLDLGDPMQWDTAAELTRRCLPLLLESEKALLLNLNAPSVPPDQLRGIQRASLASFGAVQTNITESGQGFVRISVDEIENVLEDGTDAAAIAQGYASITPLRMMTEATDVDLVMDSVAMDSVVMDSVQSASAVSLRTRSDHPAASRSG